MLSMMLAIRQATNERWAVSLYGSIVKAAYISHFVLQDNEESFPKVMVDSAPSLARSCDCHVTLYPES